MKSVVPINKPKTSVSQPFSKNGTISFQQSKSNNENQTANVTKTPTCIILSTHPNYPILKQFVGARNQFRLCSCVYPRILTKHDKRNLLLNESTSAHQHESTVRMTNTSHQHFSQPKPLGLTESCRDNVVASASTLQRDFSGNTTNRAVMPVILIMEIKVLGLQRANGSYSFAESVQKYTQKSNEDQNMEFTASKAGPK